MSNSDAQDIALRQRWMRALAQATVAELTAGVALVGKVPEYTFLRKPECGLTMVRARAGGSGAVFNLGETTLTRASVSAAGKVGHAWVMGRDKRQAELAAVCDALLQMADFQALLMCRLVHSVEARLAEQRQAQQQKVDETRVEFFTLVRGESE